MAIGASEAISRALDLRNELEREGFNRADIDVILAVAAYLHSTESEQGRARTEAVRLIASFYRLRVGRET